MGPRRLVLADHNIAAPQQRHVPSYLLSCLSVPSCWTDANTFVYRVGTRSGRVLSFQPLYPDATDESTRVLQQR
jgi:hypothetical protein